MNNDADDWIYKLREDLSVPVLGAAETGERAWGTNDEKTDYKVTVVRLESPVEHALPYSGGRTVSATARSSRQSSQSDPIAQWASVNNLPDNISIESFDFPMFVERASRNPRVMHFLQSPITYGSHHHIINEFDSLIRDSLDIRTLVREYRGWAQDMFGRDETVAHRLGSAAALSRAVYIARHKSLPPMYVDSFMEEAVEEIEDVIGLGRFERLLRLLRRNGRDHTVSSVDVTKLENNLNVKLIDKHNLQRSSSDRDASNELVRDAYEEFYDV